MKYILILPIVFMFAAVFVPKAMAASQYTIQVAALSSESAARNLVEKVEGNGIEAYYAKVRNPGKLHGLYYRVRIGVFDDKSAAKDFAKARLKPLGYKWWIDLGSPEYGEYEEAENAVEAVKLAEPVKETQISSSSGAGETIREAQTSEPQKIIVVRDTIRLEPEIRSGLEQHEQQGKSFLGRNKNIIGFSMFVISATSLALAIWQDNEASSKAGKASWLHSEMATSPNAEALRQKQNDYAKTAKEAYRSESLRDGFYIGAAVFAVACGVVFFF